MRSTMKSKHSDVLVVGGGVIGVCTAYFLAQRGANVTLLEKQAICSGASAGNAGWIFPSYSLPLQAPGSIRKALSTLFDPEGPFYIRPRLDRSLMSWGLKFLRASRASEVPRTFRINRDLSLASCSLYEDLAKALEFDFGFVQKGLLLIFKSKKELQEAEKGVRLLESQGGVGELLSLSEVREIAPQVTPELVGGIHLPADAHIDPAAFVKGMAAAVQKIGVRVVPDCEVLEMSPSCRATSCLMTTRGEFRANQIVLAAGAWSTDLMRPLGLRLPVQSAKGYSVTVKRPDESFDIPLMLAEAKVAATPMGERLRFAGTLELAGLDLSINRRRVGAILAAVEDYLPDLKPTEHIETWRGLRPCSADGLPIIGRPKGLTNVVVATGHGMTGISHGPATGKLVAEIVAGDKPSIDTEPFSPTRFQ